MWDQSVLAWWDVEVLPGRIDRFPDSSSVVDSQAFWAYDVSVGLELRGVSRFLESFRRSDTWGHYYMTADYGGIV